MIKKLRYVILIVMILYILKTINGSEIKLCENKNGKGECIIITMNDTQKCINLNNKKKWASSITLINNCFRLYEKDNCEGKSLYTTSRSPGHKDLDLIGMNKMISSIGKCFSVDICPRSKKYRINGNCPLVIEYLNIGYLSSLPKDIYNLTGPVIYYQINPQNNRTEVMEALIDNNHINTGTEISINNRKFVKEIIGSKYDIASQILSHRLGGSGIDKRNIFPINKNINNNSWKNVENKVLNVIKTNGKVRFIVNLHYNEKNDVRPDFIIYRILNGNNNEFIDQGDIVNLEYKSR